MAHSLKSFYSLLVALRLTLKLNLNEQGICACRDCMEVNDSIKD